jgi:hypothetical protein
MNKTKNLGVLAILTLLLFAVVAPAQTAPAQTRFATPQDAMHALVDAAKAGDLDGAAAIFGRAEHQQMLSGDKVEDAAAQHEFAARAEQSATLEKVDDSKYTLLVGADKWPFPIPIVKEGSQWRFDTKAGLEEIWNRRVGENEIAAISTCRAYVLAQWEYFTGDEAANDGVAEYAQKFMSSPGKKDGLYWQTHEGQQPSPLGSLVAVAFLEGYTPSTTPKGRQSYHGYYFKILTHQGPNAPGGAHGYVINGNMIAGHALVAYPDKWGSSGVMTFIVNQQGRVYEKNLGPRTAQLAGTMIDYNPDTTWRLVRE